MTELERADGKFFTAPFAVAALAWQVVEVSDTGDEARVAPYLSGAALRERLDAHLGSAGWSVRYQLAPGEAVACQLDVGAVSKGAVCAYPRFGGAPLAAALAYSAAALLHGARLPVAHDLSVWVACDPESHEPLHLPDEAMVFAQRPLAAAAPIVSSGGAAAVEALAASAGERADAAVKPDAQTMIDRLIDRLKEQGQGLAAARILVKHGGYGKDPQAARELYAALRALWLSSREAAATLPQSE